MTDENGVTEGGDKLSVTVWTTAKGRPQWRVRLTEEADDELADLVVTRAVRAFNRVREELSVGANRVFDGEEPAATPRPLGRHP